MKKNILIIIVSVIVAALGIGFFIYTLTVPKDVVEEKNSASAVEEETSKTQDIEGVEYNDAILYKADKTEINLAEYKNRPMMLLFFNKENEDSIEVLKKVEEMYKKYEEKVQFFMINTAEEVDEELANEYTLEIYYDFDKEVAKSYNVVDVPSTIYIDEINKFLNAKTGFTTTDALEANLDILSNDI